MCADIHCDSWKSTSDISKYCNSNLSERTGLKTYLRESYISEFPIEWERNILDLIFHQKEQECSTFIKSILDEIKQMYIESMKDFVLKSILSCKPYKKHGITYEKCDSPFDLKSKIIKENATYNRSIFLERHNLFTKKYFLSHPIIRHVINIGYCILPNIICDFKYYHNLGMLTLYSFQDLVSEDIKRNALIITNQFYTETFKAIQKSVVLKTMSTKRLFQFMRCLTNIFVQQILNVMMRSINHIITIMKDVNYCPQIEFQLICKDDQLLTEPNIEEVFSTYHNIIRHIQAIAQDLIPLEEWLNIKGKRKYMKVTLPNWFIEQSHNNLQQILEILFKPLNEHRTIMSMEFGSVCTSKNQMLSLTSGQINFDIYFIHINKHKEYLDKTKSIVSNLYYAIGKLEQSSAKESLQKICCYITNTLTIELVNYHQDFNHSICSDFEDIKSTALNIPQDAKSLIQLGEYMLQASKILMKELERKIEQSIYMLNKLLDITILTDEHINLNNITINWLYNIQPVFAQNNILCEAMKSELEEDLQRRINFLNSEVDAIFPQLIVLNNMDDISKIGEYKEYYKNLIKKYNNMNNEMQIINSEESLFKFPETEFSKITELKETIVPFYSLICIIYQWQRDNSVWLNGPFEYLDASIMEEKTINYFEKMTEMNKIMRSRIKMDITTNKSYKFSGIADDPDPMQQPAPLKLCWQALNDVNKFKIYLPLANCMCNPALRSRHWEEMSAICNFDLTPNAGTTLKKIIKMNLMDNIDKYKAISISASKELYLQQKLTELIKEWELISFVTSTTESGMIIFKHMNKIEALLTEHLIKIEEMRGSYFAKPILSDITDFFAILTRIQENIDQWTHAQLCKFSLKSVFSYPGIEMRLNQETTLYLEVTKILLDINDKFAENSSFQGFKKSLNLLDTLYEVNEKLEKVNKGVKDYLEIKRLAFTRFFFLADSEIQRILFESNHTAKQYTLVTKCFLGIEHLKLTESNCIQGIIGHYGESLYLNNNDQILINAECEEKWLIQLEKKMKDAIRERIIQYYPLINENLTSIPTDNISMAIFCGFQLYWTASIEKYFISQNSTLLKSLFATYINWIVCISNELKSKLTRKCRSLLISLIIVLSAHKEIITLLLDNNVIKQGEFEWIAQLRYYYNNKDVEISIFDTTITHGYEYNYYQQYIVNTPLTDRCFRTIMQAYRYHLYSGIIGPTSTGKTEIIKSLTQALAIPFYVVNCNNNISYECITQIFKGIISCGVWICFENFNRLKSELLSAIAQNLIQMKQAVSINLKSINFNGYNLNLNICGNICININSEQYKHSDLPDNLRVLFRTVSIIAPDVDKIVEIELFAGGFLHSKNLALKLTTAYRLLSEHLMEKNHYNLTVSSLKIVIATAVSMKQNLPDEDEYTLLLRSIIDISIPQLCNTDIPIFQSIMQDIFPECIMLPFDCSAILNALEIVCAKRFLTLHKTFKLKTIQIIELMYVYRGLVLIGDSLGGKTEILHTLAETFLLLYEQKSKIGAKVKLETIVSGIVEGNKLFEYACDKGSYKSWRDGLFTTIFRRFTEDTSTDRKWLILDGSVNETSMENLYTVLDENKMLYLTSGERLSMTNTIHIIFETISMVEMSPHIISRCGMIYIDSHSIDWKPYVLSHIAKSDIYNGYDTILYILFDWAIDPCLNFLSKNGDILMDQKLHIFTSLLNIFGMLLKDACEEDVGGKGRNDHFIIWAQAALILAIAWVLGGNLLNDSQIKFNTFCVSLWKGTSTRYPKPDAIKHFDITLPNEGLVQDNFYVFKGSGNWKPWSDLLKNEKISELCNFNQIFIPNINSIRYNYIFLKHIKHRKPFLLYGDVAGGKTTMMYNFLSDKLPKNYLSNIFSFTSMINVTRTQKILLSKLNKIRCATYGSEENQYCVNFIDDVHTAIIKQSETQSIFELLRQLLNYGYCYDVDELNKIFIQNVMFTFALTAKNISANISPRFLRYFNTYMISTLTMDNIFKIYSNVLLANLRKNQFAVDVTGNVTSIVNATIDIYKYIIKTLRPVPSKLHYRFDLRDISKVINGCSLIQKESIETKVTFVRLWVHEILRVFSDRMLNEEDKEWLFLNIQNTVKNNFKDSFEMAFDHLPKYENNQITRNSLNDLIFGNFMDTEKSGKCKRYEEINSMEILSKKILSYLNEYNNNFKTKIDLIVSRYMLESLIKISRILATPGGNMLLISTMGSGRRTVTTLAAFIQQQSFFETTVQYYNDTSAWKDHLKEVLQQCGALQNDITYFMSERQMKDVLLSDICCLLSIGELPDLFSIEDKQNIIEITRLHAQDSDRNAEISARLVMTYFANQCKNRLHFVLCFSPTSTAFRRYLHAYPILLKHCTINCYPVWPDQALLELAVRYTRHVNVEAEIKARIAKTCVQFYNSAKEMSLKYHEIFVKTIHITLSAFLHMLKLYKRLMSKKQEEIIAMRNRYTAGLEKLQLVAEQVEQMKATLMILKPQLELSVQQSMDITKEMENENIIVEQATILLKQEEEIANKRTEIADILKSEYDANLTVAVSTLEDALIALNMLKQTDITFVKTMKNPPDTVKLVMAAICVMLDVPPERTIHPVTGKKFMDYWSPSKRILADINFLQNLKDYNKDDITPSIMQVIKKTYMIDNNFVPHIVGKVSSAAEALCKWIRAMVFYDDVMKIMAPKKKELIAAQTERDEGEVSLNEKRQNLAILNEKLVTLQDSLRQTLQKKLNLETEIAMCTTKLIKAEKLIVNLTNEKSRWVQCVHYLQTDHGNLVGDIALSCGIVAYAASYNIPFRDKILTEWKRFMKNLEIPYTETYSFVNVLGVEIDIDYWQLCGLSMDRFAIENAIILNYSEMWCLFIDPQNQMNQWIKKIEKKNGLKVIKSTDVNYMSVIERNIEEGIPVLLENVGGTFDMALEPILLKNIYKDEIWYINIGIKSIKYSQNFRFYITTRLSSPSYMAVLSSKLTIIDFSMPNGTLRDKLLDIVISKEKPEFQEKFEALRVQNATNKKILQEQEDNILKMLSSTNINILEDEHTIQVLHSSKVLIIDVMRKQETNKVIMKDINKFRDAYLQFADYCAKLFRTVNALSNLNHMYRFSFSWFLQVYITSIETSNRSVVMEKRLQFLKSSFMRNLYSSVCRSLFQIHKLVYSFVLCAEILLDTQQVTRQEVQFFISPDAETNDTIFEEGPEWLSMEVWKQICTLSTILPNVHGLAHDFRVNSKAWERYCKTIPFQNHLIPKPWINNLTRFQKLMLIKIIRYDKIFVEIIQLIEDTMGNVFNSISHLKISESYTQSNCLTPIIFILPSYSSPLSLVSTFANVKGYTSKFVSLSLSDGQENRTESLIEQARREGKWIFLQNCHHILSWIPRLEQIFENLSILSNTSLDFRLWLSSNSIPEFPISILQSSIKIAYDYPFQLKQSILRTYLTEPICNKEFFDVCPEKEKDFSKLLYGLCFFHSIVRDREYFGPQNWSIPYDFDHTDFEISIVQLQNLINENKSIPFNILLYLISECNYGGKIMDRFDQRYLQCLLDSFCNIYMLNKDKYSFSNHPEHLIPQRCEYRDIIMHINDTQLDVSSEVFTFNESAIVIRDTAIIRDFINSISILDQIKTLNDDIAENEIFETIDEINDKLPNVFDINEIGDQYPCTSRTPLNALLIHEIELINKIVITISNSLNKLKLALAGDVVLTETLEDLSKEICNKKVPYTWKIIDIGITTRYLPNYINLLLKRVNFVQNWHNEGLSHVIHFDVLSSCKRFLSAVLLVFSRRHNIPVEHIIPYFKVAITDSDHNKEDNLDTYYIYGLHLYGAQWNMQRHTLMDGSLNQFWHDMPPIRLTFGRKEKKTVNNIYECPMYISPIRYNKMSTDISARKTRNYIITVPLETIVPYTYWIKRGVSLFCQVDK